MSSLNILFKKLFMFLLIPSCLISVSALSSYTEDNFVYHPAPVGNLTREEAFFVHFSFFNYCKEKKGGKMKNIEARRLHLVDDYGKYNGNYVDMFKWENKPGVYTTCETIPVYVNNKLLCEENDSNYSLIVTTSTGKCYTSQEAYDLKYINDNDLDSIIEHDNQINGRNLNEYYETY